MLRNPRERRRIPCLRRCPDLTVALTVIVCLTSASAASAAEAVGNPFTPRHYPLAQIFTFLFLMLGPFKIIGPFAQVTKDLDAAQTRRVALWASLFASAALLIAGLLGERILSSYGIPVAVLGLSGGVILFLVALINILQQFVPHAPQAVEAANTPPKSVLSLALTSLAFPTIVTPYGIATLVVFLAISPDTHSRWTVAGVVVAIMLLNLVMMLVTRRLLPVLGVLLPIVGAVLGVVQVALGLQIINNALRALGAV